MTEQRDCRLNENVKTLYHITDPNAAKAIEDSGKMYRGSNGMLGPGIYFGEHISVCEKKARKHGYVVEAEVKLGKTKEVSKPGLLNYLVGSHKFTHNRLLKDGFDSVVCDTPTGTEYVVYNYDQVSIKRVYQPDGDSSDSDDG